MWRTAFAFGHTQAWLAKHINQRHPTWPLLLPAWAITRTTFIAIFTALERLYRDETGGSL